MDEGKFGKITGTLGTICAPPTGSREEFQTRGGGTLKLTRLQIFLIIKPNFKSCSPLPLLHCAHRSNKFPVKELITGGKVIIFASRHRRTS